MSFARKFRACICKLPGRGAGEGGGGGGGNAFEKKTKKKGGESIP